MSPETGAKSLLVMRHGETTWNRERRIMGHADVPLSEQGRAQSAGAARLVAGLDIQRIVSSPLLRAAETAAIVGGALGLPVTEDADLEEVRFGRWQGKTYKEITADPLYHAFVADPLTQRTPGGETIVDVQRRGIASLERMHPGECVLFVSHGDIIRAVLCRYLGIPLAEFRRLRVDNCGVSAVLLGGERAEVKFINLLADPERAWDSPHWDGRGA